MRFWFVEVEQMNMAGERGGQQRQPSPISVSWPVGFFLDLAKGQAIFNAWGIKDTEVAWVEADKNLPSSGMMRYLYAQLASKKSDSLKEVIV